MPCSFANVERPALASSPLSKTITNVRVPCCSSRSRAFTRSLVQGLCRSAVDQRQLDQCVGAWQGVQPATRRDEFVKLFGGNWDSADHSRNSSDLLGKIPDELASGAVARKGPTVFQANCDARREQRLRVRRDQLDPMHQLEHFRWVAASRVQNGKAAFDHTV